MGWSGSAIVLDKLSVPGHPTDLDNSGARAYCACSRYGWVLFRHFFFPLSFSLLSPSLWETALYRPKYCLEGPLLDGRTAPVPRLWIRSAEIRGERR